MNLANFEIIRDLDKRFLRNCIAQESLVRISQANFLSKALVEQSQVPDSKPSWQHFSSKKHALNFYKQRFVGSYEQKLQPFFVVLVAYALTWGTTTNSIQVPAQNDPNDNKMIMDKIGHFLGAQASVLLMIIVLISCSGFIEVLDKLLEQFMVILIKGKEIGFLFDFLSPINGSWILFKKTKNWNKVLGFRLKNKSISHRCLLNFMCLVTYP